MIDDGKLSYEELTSIYLFRIQEHDQNGITLNSVTEINPNVMEEARKLDQERGRNKNSNLYGIPVVVKDNVQTEKVMPTSAGTYVLKDWIADQDATIVKQLKEEGAFVLGKANTSEWANYLSLQCQAGIAEERTKFKPVRSDYIRYFRIKFRICYSSCSRFCAACNWNRNDGIDCCTSGAAISSWVTSIFRYGK